MTLQKALLASALSLVALCGTAQAQTAFFDDVKVVTNNNRGILETADIVIENGRITAIGTDLSAPAGATVRQGGDFWVTPGLFAPIAQIGLVEIGLEDSTNDTRSEKGETSISDLAVDSFNPNSPVVDNTRIEGITHAAVNMSAARNIFGGTGLVANTSGGFDSVINGNAFVLVELGSGGADLAGGSRSAAMSQFRAALDDASAYPARYDSPSDGDTLPRRDAAALAKAARGQMPIMIEADRASDLLRIVDLKSEYGGLDIIIVGAAEGWMVADQLADADIKVMVDPMENLPDSFDKVGASFDNVKALDAAGVDYAIYSRVSGISNNVRLLPQHAGNAVAHGLDWQSAFDAISATPARWFGVDSGTLARGSDTVVVWDGDPLEVTSSPQWMMIDGEVVSLESRQTELRDRYNPTSNETKHFKYR